MWRNTFWDEFERLQNEFFQDWFDDHPADRLLPRQKGQALSTNYRKAVVDTYETDKKFVADVELPGVNKDDIEINVHDDYLEVKVEKKDEDKQEKDGVYTYRKSYSGFYKCFSLPKNVDSNNIDAKYEDGVLKLSMPKKTSSKDIKRIEVK
ncbi:Hsp20/alpha crystallin family protein [Candidatus Woesearchaeota archaeon]|nr:Hsp20/alpha crystallin family protein [Candidatus Woesearchaeota archaeon]